MAENKKSVLLYCDIIHTIESLTDDEAGRLFKHLLRYVNDMNPEAPDRITQIAFEPIKQQLKRDLKRWETELEGKSVGGRLGNLKRWNFDLYTQVIDNQLNIDDAERIAKGRIVSHTDTPQSDSIGSVAVNVTVNDNVINIPFGVFWDLYDKKQGNKIACEKKWEKLKDAERTKVIETLPVFLSKIKEKQFQPFPATYLNQQRWNDDLGIEKFNKDKFAPDLKGFINND